MVFEVATDGKLTKTAKKRSSRVFGRQGHRPLFCRPALPKHIAPTMSPAERRPRRAGRERAAHQRTPPRATLPRYEKPTKSYYYVLFYGNLLQQGKNIFSMFSCFFDVLVHRVGTTMRPQSLPEVSVLFCIMRLCGVRVYVYVYVCRYV